MKFDPEKHYRRSIRLKGYDYTQAGIYFVTICTQNRECLFGEIVEEEMRLNDWGQVVQDEWFRTSVVRPNVELDVFVVMPNHVHGIICIVDDGRGTARRAFAFERFGNPVGAQRAAPLHSHSPRHTLNNVAAGSLGAIVRAFKSATTKRVNETRQTPGVPVWQRNYYEHVIRNEPELDRIREYIVGNPASWEQDINNPAYGSDGKTRPLEEEFRGIFTEPGYGRNRTTVQGRRGTNP